MPATVRAMFLAHAGTPEFGRALADAGRRLDAAFAACRRPYVAYSGGKDSLVVTHLALQREPGMLVWHWDYGPRFMPRGIEAEIVANARAVVAVNLEIETSPLYETDFAGRVFVPHLFRRTFPRLRAAGYDGALVGLRAEESGKRRRRIAVGESIGPIPEHWPVAAWGWRDVWAYVVSRGLPYPAVYDERARLLGWDGVRMCTFFDPEFERVGSTTVDGVLHWRLRGRG